MEHRDGWLREVAAAVGLDAGELRRLDDPLNRDNRVLTRVAVAAYSAAYVAFAQAFEASTAAAGIEAATVALLRTRLPAGVVATSEQHDEARLDTKVALFNRWLDELDERSGNAHPIIGFLRDQGAVQFALLVARCANDPELHRAASLRVAANFCVTANHKYRDDVLLAHALYLSLDPSARRLYDAALFSNTSGTPVFWQGPVLYSCFLFVISLVLRSFCLTIYLSFLLSCVLFHLSLSLARSRFRSQTQTRFSFRYR